MTRKNLFFLLILVASALTLISKAGGPGTLLMQQVTGAPGETTCLSCHDGAGGGGGNILISAPDLAGGYSPGQSYNITVTVSDPNAVVGGFQAVVLDANNQNAGSFTPGSGMSTVVLPTPSDKIYIEHSTPDFFSGIPGNNTVSWSFTWIAPAAPAGPVQFYAAGLAANFSSAPDGDDVYTTTLPVGTLPVEYAGISASLTDQGLVRVDWSTSLEINAGFFEVERSLDGVIFTAAGSLPAKGDATSLTSYSFVDPSPVFGTQSYYRVKETDIDGSLHYSDKVRIRVPEPKTGLKAVYPNPAILAGHLQLDILIANDQQVEARLFNMEGEAVYVRRINPDPGLHTLTIPVGNLPSGNYYTEVKTGNTFHRSKVVIAN